MVAIQNTDATAGNLSVLTFQDPASTTAAIYSYNTDHTNHYGTLGFLTRNSDGYLERMTLNNTGATFAGNLNADRWSNHFLDNWC